MLGPIRRLLGGRGVILSSKSPRRRDILENIGFPFSVVPSTFEENLDKSVFSQPWEYAVENSRQKALEVARRLEDRKDWAVIVGADTIVVLNGEIMEKPGTAETAQQMLQSLSGHTHLVFTGMTLVYRDVHGVLTESCFHEVTEVTFASLSAEVIDSYVSSQEPLDKAGAYGIQGLGGTLVSGISGDYFNVVGLPLHRLCLELMALLSRGIDTTV